MRYFFACTGAFFAVLFIGSHVLGVHDGQNENYDTERASYTHYAPNDSEDVKEIDYQPSRRQTVDETREIRAQRHVLRHRRKQAEEKASNTPYFDHLRTQQRFSAEEKI